MFWKKKKHFLVFYQGSYEDGIGYGNLLYSTYNDFVSQSEICKHLETNNKYKNALITNIIRLSNKEYEHWYKDKPNI